MMKTQKRRAIQARGLTGGIKLAYLVLVERGQRLVFSMKKPTKVAVKTSRRRAIILANSP